MRNMDRWLGDGGMPIIGIVGASFDSYGPGWVMASWKPVDMCCNPGGIVQAGVTSVICDAAMNFALNAALGDGDRSKATLEMKTETMKAMKVGDSLAVRGEVVKVSRQFAWLEARVTLGDPEGALTARSTATFAVHRSS